MTILVPNDPIEGWQKRTKKKIQKSASAFLALLRKALVHRQTLMFIVNMGFGLFKLIKFVLSLS